MTGIEPRTSSIGIDHTANWDTTTALHKLNCYFTSYSSFILFFFWASINSSSLLFNTKKCVNGRSSSIAQWNRQRQLSCGPRFESQAQHLHSIYIVQIIYLSFEMECEKNENEQKRRRNWSIKKYVNGDQCRCQIKKASCHGFCLTCTCCKLICAKVSFNYFYRHNLPNCYT